jgi:2-hydroxy-3-keto-5-methylthiopentenyl-1-phosphate phosphatase
MGACESGSPLYHQAVHPLLDLDLARTSVFVDFDGTISMRDVGMHVLDRLAAPEWWALHDAYDAGEIGSRECISGQWALVEASEEQARAVAREVALDTGFEPLVDGLRGAGAEVTVVSDGFGFYVEEVCDALGVRVLTNTVDFATGELLFPHEDRCCPCSTCGVCKQAPIKDARHRGQSTVLIGDGTSDRKAALLADVVFAKDELATWCSANAVRHVRFGCLDDVRRTLLTEDAA